MIYTAVVSCWTSARSLLSLFTEMCQTSAKGIPDWYTPVILVLRKLGQEICKLEASIGFMMRSCLNKTKQYPHQNKTPNQPNESHISTELNCLHVLKMPDGSSRSASAFDMKLLPLKHWRMLVWSVTWTMTQVVSFPCSSEDDCTQKQDL